MYRIQPREAPWWVKGVDTGSGFESEASEFGDVSQVFPRVAGYSKGY